MISTLASPVKSLPLAPEAAPSFFIKSDDYVKTAVAATDKPQEESVSGTFFDPSKILRDISVAEGMKIADFGAGTGYFTFAASRMVGQSGMIWALDVKKSAIKHLEDDILFRNLTNVRAIWTNLEMRRLNPIPDNSIDLVLIANMLFQSHKYGEIFGEAYRELKPGGRVVIIDWQKAYIPFGPPGDDRVDLEKLKEAAYSIGFNKIREFEPSPYHFGIIFRK